jgi:hypothetical protein
MTIRWQLIASLGLTWVTMAFAPTYAETYAANTQQQQLASTSCAALRSAAQAIPGDGPMLLPSYPSLKTQTDAASKALENVAFVYDNALAGIAFIACGEPDQARRIADALLVAAAHDPSRMGDGVMPIAAAPSTATRSRFLATGKAKVITGARILIRSAPPRAMSRGARCCC